MAQSVVEEQQEESLHHNLRNILAKLNINTVEEFFGLDKKQIRRWLSLIAIEIVQSIPTSSSDFMLWYATLMATILFLIDKGCFRASCRPHPFQPGQIQPRNP
ncbi:hypothetical protein PGT21_025861 [Puccinia graminis f. sp. tritici]|uniref:Uncharacterized protein n=1 Tax=Puccinia graminis f. sp. tritici TaxID=56615 RepID=A0A5B0NNY8_PUCGR|nr:hypothetical protein PGT21_025861 [Puccinia graminis f. sp. tritici]